MIEKMIDRIALALVPHIHHGISDPRQAALDVLSVMREPTADMLEAASRYNALSDADRTWPSMIDAALNEDS